MSKQPAKKINSDYSKSLNRKVHQGRNNKKSSLSLIDNYELPKGYNDTKVTLISRTPSNAHAYWEVSSGSLASIKKKLGKYFNDAHYYLRVYETAGEPESDSPCPRSFDVNIQLSDKKRYVDLPRDDAYYFAHLGYKSNNGDFQILASSNSISSQRNGPANNPTLKWKSVNNDTSKSTPEYSKKSYQKYTRPKSQDSLRKEFSLYGGRVPLSVEEIWAYYSKLSPLLRKIHMEKVKSKIKGVEILTSGSKEALAQDSMQINHHDNILIKDEKSPKSFHGASDSFVPESQASDHMQPQDNTGSSDKQIQATRRNFFFELHTELIVYGRTEPDATVMHGTQEVPLNSDGTFSLRFSLPDGKIPLDFTALSFDKMEKRSILTAVERSKTMYVPV